MKKFISLMIASILAVGMTTSVFAAVGDAENTTMKAIDETGLTVISPSSQDIAGSKYLKLVGANVGTSHHARGVLLMDNDCSTYWVLWGEAGLSPTLHLLLNDPMPLDKVFVAFPWDAQTDSTTSAFPSGTYGVAVYATFMDGTVERLTYTGNTITDSTTARTIELTNKTKAVKMISVSRVPRNTLDGTAGFWDNVPGSKVPQALSISEIKLYAPTSSLPVAGETVDATITKDGEVVACLSDGYTAGVANQLLGNTSNPLSSYSDMLSLNIPAAQYFDAYYKTTNNGAVLSGDTEVTLAAGEHILIDIGKYSHVSEVEIAADTYAGLTVKGSNMTTAFDDADVFSGLTQNADGLYSSTVTNPSNRYRYIAVYNGGDADVNLSEVAVYASNNDPALVVGDNSIADGLRYWNGSTYVEVESGATDATVPAGTSYVWTRNVTVPVATGQKYVAVLAIYKENGEMIQMHTSDVTMNSTKVKFDVLLSAGNNKLEARKAKCMLIDSLTSGMIYATEEFTISAPAQ